MRRPLSTALEPSQRLSHFAARGHEFWQGWHFRLEDLRATRQSDPESRATVTSDNDHVRRTPPDAAIPAYGSIRPPRSTARRSVICGRNLHISPDTT